MSITVNPLPIDGLFSIEPRIFDDARGYFFESWNERDFREQGLGIRFVQDNQSRSHRGVLRGLHFQKTRPQGKLVHVLSGEVFDVAVDLRSGSPTFGKWAGVTLSGEAHNLFFIPAGFAHGFLVLSDEAVFAYKCTDYYHPEDEDGISWDDPVIGIEWPDTGAALQLSAKDRKLPAFDPQRRYFCPEGLRE